jgi:hypothetical protein
MKESQFSCDRFVQTTAEHLSDKKRMKKLKKQLESSLKGTTLHIDEASEWAQVWRIPITFNQGATELRESHFQVVRGYGVELCVIETFSEDHNNEYIVEMKKCRQRWRGWTLWEQLLLFSTILGILFCMYIIYLHVQ